MRRQLITLQDCDSPGNSSDTPALCEVQGCRYNSDSRSQCIHRQHKRSFVGVRRYGMGSKQRRYNRRSIDDARAVSKRYKSAGGNDAHEIYAAVEEVRYGQHKQPV